MLTRDGSGGTCAAHDGAGIAARDNPGRSALPAVHAGRARRSARVIVRLTGIGTGLRRARYSHVVLGDTEHLTRGHRVGEVRSDSPRFRRAGEPMGRFVTQRSHLFTICCRDGEAAARGGGLSQGSETIDLADHEAAALPSNRHRMAYSDMTYVLIFAFSGARRAPLPQRRCWRQAGFGAATVREALGRLDSASAHQYPRSIITMKSHRLPTGARHRSHRPLRSRSPPPAPATKRRGMDLCDRFVGKLMG
jgi:hypothetical protein